MTGAGGVGAMRLMTKAQDIESLLQREKVARVSETEGERVYQIIQAVYDLG